MMARFQIITVLVYLFIIPLRILFCQIVEPKFDTFPVNVPRCIIQDSFGFIWIGTFDGLVRYDGYSFRHYSQIPFDSTSLSNNWVMEIQEARNGNLWIGTFGGGLNYFDQRTEKFTTFNTEKFSQINNFVSKIIVNEDGSLWLGSTGSGLTWFKKSTDGNVTFKQYKFSDKPGNDILSFSNSVLSLHKDLKGIIWIGTATEGLIRFNPDTKEMTFFNYDPGNPKSISSNTISTICEDDSGNLWIGTGHPSIPPGFGEGLNFFDPKKNEFIRYKHDRLNKASICSNTITSIVIDQSGIMWIGSWGNYLNSVSVHELLTKKIPTFKHYTILSTNTITSLYEDQIGNIWIGVFGMDLYKIDQQNKQFATYNRNDNYPESLTYSGVIGLYIDKSGCIWFGTRGLDIYDPVTNKYSHYYAGSKDGSGLNDNSVTGIQEDDKGRIWITTNNSGINIFDKKSRAFQQIQHRENNPSGLISNSIKYILKRHNGDLWLGTTHAGIELYHSKTGKFIHFDLDSDTFEDNAIITMCEDRRGILWTGTFNGGLYGLTIRDTLRVNTVNYRYNPKNRESLSCNTVSAILQPEIVDTNALWIGTDAGLNRFDQTDKIFKHFFRSDGLASDHIMRILEDDQGNIWCATVEGLSVYEIRTGRIKSFGKGDGLPFTDFSNLGPNAKKGPDGKLYFSGISGTLSFYPDQLIDNPNIPVIQFTDFKVLSENTRLDTSILYKKSITLTAAQNVFSFDFAALNFTNPESNQYKYKMDGFHDDWIYIGNERTASFTNLDPGKYVFRVKGSNNHGLWNEEGTSINVIILSPWWKTWWARSFIAFGLLFILVAFYWRRTAYLKNRVESRRRYAEQLIQAQEEERKRIASELHDSHGQNLLIMSNELQQFAEDHPQNGKDLAPVLQTMQEAIQDVRVISSELHPHVLERLGLRKALESMVQKIQTITGIRFKIQFAGEVDQLDKKLALQVFRVVQESLNNIVKHADASEVKIVFDRNKGGWYLVISDDGAGFEVHKALRSGTGLGLADMRQRTDIMKARFKIISHPGQGTRIQLSFRDGIIKA